MALTRDHERRFEEYWDWVAVALFLLLSVDLLTSLSAASVVGVEHEANPLMAWMLTQSLGLIVAVHAVVLVLAVAFFYALFEVTRDVPAAYRRPAALSVEVFLGTLVAVGLFVFANNVSLLVLGDSLL